jgi:single-stranded-DNA-specific exonuclease
LPTPPDETSVAALVATLHLPPTVARLLCQRGFGDIERAKRYLRPRLEHLHVPGAMRDLDGAVERLVTAIRSDELVLVHGDYDVDGMCSTSLLLRTIRILGGRAIPFIPRRLEDGYDLGDAGVRAAIAAGASVLVSSDCGTNALAPVAALGEAGIDVIVADHHLPSGPLPSSLAVLNPKRPGCEYPDKDLAAVGVVFKLAVALTRAMHADVTPVYRMLDLVALATIADVAPLRGENRIFSRAGLRLLTQSNNAGLRAMLRAAGLADKRVTAGQVAFILAPRLNAAGRIGHALRGVELLTTDDEGHANSIARELEEMNLRRQEIDRATLAAAQRLLDTVDLDATAGLVLAADGWHPGVIGIVASRLVEEIHRPVVLVALDGESGKGSGRSIAAFDLHEGLTECRDLLTRFGGHRAAAGLTVERRNVDAFRARFNEVAKSKLEPDDLVPQLRVDLEISMAEATGDLESLLRHFEPFGVGNAAPVFVVRGVRLAAPPRVVGADHLRLRLTGEGKYLDAIGWRMAALATELPPNAELEVAFRLERDEWSGLPRLQAKLADIRF